MYALEGDAKKDVTDTRMRPREQERDVTVYFICLTRQDMEEVFFYAKNGTNF